MSIESIKSKIHDVERELERATTRLQSKEKDVEDIKKDMAKLEGKKAEYNAEVAKMQATLDKLAPKE